ncbi:MAG: type II 3-dehydroquinate dehydratase [Clostridia bacterium]|nr:type II 3-dehydroquinate dehydratase [Clostridia bacterium]
MKTKILLINGPNLNMLGIRNPKVYGKTTLKDIEKELTAYARTENCKLYCFQSNHEGSIIDKIHAAYKKIDGIIINPGAFTHYSYAIRDALESVSIPTVEIHLSDIHNREEFRKTSVISPVAIKQIAGHGKDGYGMALDSLLEHIKND